MKQKTLLAFSLLWLCVFAQAEVFYWLSGNDVKTTIEGSENFFMSGTPPNASSAITEIMIETTQGSGEIGKWYSPAFSEGFLLSGKVYLLANKFKQLLGKTTVNFSLYEFDEEEGTQTLIVSSESEKPVNPFTLQAEVVNGFVVRPGKRLKLVLSYIEESQNGKISLTIDEGSPLKETILETPNGIKAKASGADGVAVLILDACSESSISCTTDEGCSDQNNFTTDICSLAGTCKAECVYDVCETECTSHAQCSDNEPLTNDRCENLGFCNSFCTNTACQIMCNSSLDCDDSDLATLDTCIYPGTCLSSCKNTVCTTQDCDIEAQPFCGDNKCQYGENCPSDCGTGKNIDILSYRKGDYFTRGEEIIFEAKPLGFQKTPQVFVNGFFGEQQLFDDGKGKDTHAFDGIYSGSVIVTDSADNAEEIVFSAKIEDETLQISASYIIAPVIELVVLTNKDTYYPSEIIEITGEANRKGKPLFEEDVIIKVKSANTVISTYETPVDEFGFFKAGYRTSSVQGEGDLEITVSAKDTYGNSGNSSKNILQIKKSAQPEPHTPPLGPQTNQANTTLPKENFFDIGKNYLLIIGTLIVLGVLFSKFLKKQKLQKQSLHEEELNITSEIKRLQEIYFKKALMTRKDYDEKMLKLQGRLSEIRKKLGGKNT